MDIETLAAERPDALARIPVDPRVGIDQANADEIVAAAGLSGPDAEEIARVLQLLGTVYEKEDATLVEVNPLVKTGDGKIIALDAKVSLDENAEFRHPDHAALADKSAENPLHSSSLPTKVARVCHGRLSTLRRSSSLGRDCRRAPLA